MAHRLWDEPYCPLPRRLIASADVWSLDHLRKLAASGQKAVAELLLALIAAGIGMTIAGSSAPSSGVNISSRIGWTFKPTVAGARLPCVGLQVGVGTLAALALYELWLGTELGGRLS